MRSPKNRPKAQDPGDRERLKLGLATGIVDVAVTAVARYLDIEDDKARRLLFAAVKALER